MSAKREVIAPPMPGLDAARNFNKPQSMVVRGDEFVFVAGLTAVDPKTGARAVGTTAQETQQILANMQALLEGAGSSMAKVVKVNVLLASMLETPNMNEVYARFFPEPPPARTVCGARLPDGVRVMIECTALA
jgi:2-iminobutanoate/2-iminopropanoate deaminase